LWRPRLGSHGVLHRCARSGRHAFRPGWRRWLTGRHRGNRRIGGTRHLGWGVAQIGSSGGLEWDRLTGTGKQRLAGWRAGLRVGKIRSRPRRGSFRFGRRRHIGVDPRRRLGTRRVHGNFLPILRDRKDDATLVPFAWPARFASRPSADIPRRSRGKPRRSAGNAPDRACGTPGHRRRRCRRRCGTTRC
jgi:hypothetical protein